MAVEKYEYKRKSEGIILSSKEYPPKKLRFKYLPTASKGISKRPRFLREIKTQESYIMQTLVERY